MQNALPHGGEKIRLEGTFRAKYRVFAVFLICCAILLAGFAVSAIFSNSRVNEFFSRYEYQAPPDGALPPTVAPPDQQGQPLPVPDGATRIVSRDLTVPSAGSLYIHNETPYRPDLATLLTDLPKPHIPTDEPLVLILHTHTCEGYLPSGTEYLTGEIGDATYTDDPAQSVLAIGAELTRVLNENGIGAIHCEIAHDIPSLGGSYDRSAETVRSYLAEYPSIEYVIDLHRDAVLNSEGALVRAVSDDSENAVAQVMAVVGTDVNGTEHPNWEGNLALALALREILNADGERVCRPVFLRNASFHQELAKHSLLLEIGTCANSIDEAKRAAQRVGNALVTLIYGS